ncbi:hypothetical protein [Agromyces humatus]|uniref:Transcriptional regulator, AbiEi antitoxin, Type IV TA system n=1 Tax=Agromyces humatus TaxID=279573 RepID=A0ABN2KYX5_9MICO|nr:hypothetical protein [Agromyces humatus]
MHAFPHTESGFILARDVRAVGQEAGLRAAVAAGEMVRTRRGVYRDATVARSEEARSERDALRYRADVLAAVEVLLAPTFTSFSAIALHGLPIFGRWPRDAYVLSGSSTGHRRKGLIAVASLRAAPGTTVVGGIRCTTVEYSLIQLCRHATLAAALTAVDAAVHTPRFGRARPLTTISRLRAEHRRLLPYHGSQRTEAVLGRATTEADTPLETVSRLVIEELGFAAPDLQHRLWLPELKQEAFIDFHWPDVSAGAEADGGGKYLAPALAAAGRWSPPGDGQRADPEVAATAAREAAAAVIKEKERENAVRRQLRAFDRWNWAETMARTPLAHRLMAMGVPRPRAPRMLLGDQDAPAARRIRRARRTTIAPATD